MSATAHSASDWSRDLGLAPVALHRPGAYHPSDSILLDGTASSVALFLGDDRRHFDEDPLSWTWSSYVRHAIFATTPEAPVYVRSWATPREVRKIRAAPDAMSRQRLHAWISAQSEPKSQSVVQHVLEVFRHVRGITEQAGPSLPVEAAIHVFSDLLLAVDAARESASPRDLRAARTLVDLQKFIDGRDTSPVSGSWAKNLQVGGLAEQLLEPERTTGCRLDAGMLLRHASGELFQMAHLDIERSAQLWFPGLTGPVPATGVAKPDARYTPCSLARYLVERALAQTAHVGSELTILDPACGSGVFLIEALKEVVRKNGARRVRLVGWDNSAIACAMTNVALRFASREAQQAGFHVEVDVKTADSLTTPWPPADVVLMNPPFVDWNRMSLAAREHVRDALGRTARGKPDMAMAFIRIAVRHLGPGGVLATVLPSPLLESNGGLGWRQEIADLARVELIGRFGDYAYFQGALVEPAFLLARRLDDKNPSTLKPIPIQLVAAEPGSEDAAIRTLRLHDAGVPAEQDGVTTLLVPANFLQRGSWVPRATKSLRALWALEQNHATRVGELFDVKQGTITGLNDAFEISASAHRELPPREKKYFRPAAAVRGAALNSDEWVFYPYDAEGLSIRSENHLTSELPRFARHLQKYRDALARRDRIRDWWVPTTPRRWQYVPKPKIVSNYFGREGAFAFDDRGAHLVLQGYGWLWKGEPTEEVVQPRKGTTVSRAFEDTDLPWAYVALLNSAFFAELLAMHCPSVQGGQFNLSKRFIVQVPLPDLRDSLAGGAQNVAALATLGRKMSTGEGVVNAEKLEHAARLAYGCPVEGR